jgi:cupin fold WbuC family metalloprotein
MMDNVFHCRDTVIGVRIDQWVPTLDAAARRSPLRRSRLCLHTDPGDAIQEMLILMLADSVVFPHGQVGNSKSYHLIEGRMTVVFMTDDGDIHSCLDLAAAGGDAPSLFRLNGKLWHSVICRSERVVYHEVTGGPFVPTAPGVPSWLPEDEESKVAHHRTLLQRAGAWMAKSETLPS